MRFSQHVRGQTCSCLVRREVLGKALLYLNLFTTTGAHGPGAEARVTRDEAVRHWWGRPRVTRRRPRPTSGAGERHGREGPAPQDLAVSIRCLSNMRAVPGRCAGGDLRQEQTVRDRLQPYFGGHCQRSQCPSVILMPGEPACCKNT